MDVILLQDVENLGFAGDIVSVKPGYARNYLVPRGLALRASKRNLAVAEEQKKISAARTRRERKAQEALVGKLTGIELTIEVQVGEEEGVVGNLPEPGLVAGVIPDGVWALGDSLLEHFQSSQVLRNDHFRVVHPTSFSAGVPAFCAVPATWLCREVRVCNTHP